MLVENLWVTFFLILFLLNHPNLLRYGFSSRDLFWEFFFSLYIQLFELGNMVPVWPNFSFLSFLIAISIDWMDFVGFEVGDSSIFKLFDFSQRRISLILINRWWWSNLFISTYIFLNFVRFIFHFVDINSAILQMTVWSSF